MNFRLIIILISIAIIAFGIYWFDIKPSQARMECANKASDIKFAESANIEKTNENIRRVEQTVNFEYEICLHQKGY